MNKYEELKNRLNEFLEADVFDEVCKVIDKAEAFDLIKEKEVDIHKLIGLFKQSDTDVTDYNYWFKPDKMHLTEEEFNLLKEVLKNE